MTVKEKANALKNDSESIAQAKDRALHGLRKRVVNLHHHTVQHSDYDFETTKTSIDELKYWNDVVCELEEIELATEDSGNKNTNGIINPGA